MPDIKILNWNIQNFGPKKSGLQDVVSAIAQTVIASKADVFVMLEMNTTGVATAWGLATRMREELERQSGQFKACVLSPNTGLEFYAYFVRDPQLTRPILLTEPTVPAGGVVPELSAEPGRQLADAVFTLQDAAVSGVLGPFPLLAPDFHAPAAGSRTLRSRPVPTWQGRLPVLGLFEIPSASPGHQLLPILACHFSPDPATAGAQLGHLQCVSLLTPPPPQLKIRPGAGLAPKATQISGWVLIGDFNIDAGDPNQRDYYAPLTTLGAKLWLNQKSLLVTPKQLAKIIHQPHGFPGFTQTIIDEMCTAGALTSADGAFALVSDVPEEVRARRVRLNQSVEHYKELDQKGFDRDDKDAYPELVRNFAWQLTGDSSILIGVPAQLLGARLISDHLPVLLTVRVP